MQNPIKNPLPDSATAILQAYSKGEVTAKKQEDGTYAFPWVVPGLRNGKPYPSLKEIIVRIGEADYIDLKKTVVEYQAVCNGLLISSGFLGCPTLKSLEDDIIVFEWKRQDINSAAMKLESARPAVSDDASSNAAVYVDASEVIEGILQRNREQTAQLEAKVAKIDDLEKRLASTEQELSRLKTAQQSSATKAEAPLIERALIPDPDSEFTARDFCYLIGWNGQTKEETIDYVFKKYNISPQRQIPKKDKTRTRGVYRFSQIEPKLEELCKDLKKFYDPYITITPEIIKEGFTYINYTESDKLAKPRYLAFRFRMSESNIKVLIAKNDLQLKIKNGKSGYELRKVSEIIENRQTVSRWEDSELRMPQLIYMEQNTEQKG